MNTQYQWTNTHINCLEYKGETLNTSCGKEVRIYNFRHESLDEKIFSDWARHFRNHYCSDQKIGILKPPKMSNTEYLTTLKFPDKSKPPGPSIRSGDFCEILIADFFEFMEEFYFSRTRYDSKMVANESPKGTDVIGLKRVSTQAGSDDELLICEVKAALSENRNKNVLQEAVDHSEKDEIRLAESLNAMKQRLFDRGQMSEVSDVERFQANVDSPYKTKYVAAAVISNSSFDGELLKESDTSEHNYQDNLELVVLKGDKLMKLVHKLYEVAANEA